jgi:hypothetical protein
MTHYRDCVWFGERVADQFTQDKDYLTITREIVEGASVTKDEAEMQSSLAIARRMEAEGGLL